MTNYTDIVLDTANEEEIEHPTEEEFYAVKLLFLPVEVQKPQIYTFYYRPLITVQNLFWIELYN